MAGTDRSWTYRGYTLRSGRPEEAEAYYAAGFARPDREVARLTGSSLSYDREQVLAYFHRCLVAADRYDFLLIAPDGRIVGESVIHEIDWDARCADFRICLFHTEDCGRGVGSWAVRRTRDFAFEVLALHRLELDVYAINPRAERAYLAAGFRREGVRREAIPMDGGWTDDILMAILEGEWREQKRGRRPAGRPDTARPPALTDAT